MILRMNAKTAAAVPTCKANTAWAIFAIEDDDGPEWQHIDTLWSEESALREAETWGNAAIVRIPLPEVEVPE